MKKLFLIIFLSAGLFYGCKNAEDEQRAIVSNDLVQIETAKQQWGIEQAGAKMLKNVEPSRNWDTNRSLAEQTPSEDDLKPYLSGEFPVHPPGGQYVINSLGKEPVSTLFGTKNEISKAIQKPGSK